MSEDASAECVRQFGFVQLTWATRESHQDEDSRADHIERFDRQVASFETRFSATVLYPDTGTIEFELNEPEQPPLEDSPVYDPMNEIMDISGESLEPKLLKDLTTIVMIVGMHDKEVCHAITQESQSSFPNKWYACGRKLKLARKSCFCWRHVATMTSYNGAHASREVDWTGATYAAVCPENGSAFIWKFSGPTGDADALKHALASGYRSLASAVSPCFDTTEHAGSPQKIAFSEHSCRVKNTDALEREEAEYKDADDNYSVMSSDYDLDAKNAEGQAEHELVALQKELALLRVQTDAQQAKKTGIARFYAVGAGLELAIYNNWPDCNQQVSGVSNAEHKSFTTRVAAEEWMADRGLVLYGTRARGKYGRADEVPFCQAKGCREKCCHRSLGVFKDATGFFNHCCRSCATPLAGEVTTPLQQVDLIQLPGAVFAEMTATSFQTGGGEALQDQHLRGGGPAVLPIVPPPGAAAQRRRVPAPRAGGSLTRAQVQMHEEQTAENYNQEFHGNPHGPNRLAPLSRSPYVLSFADVAGSAALRALPEYPAMRALLEAMQSALRQRNSARFELWVQGEEALSLAQAVREGANRPYGATEPDAQLANSLSCEIHEMLAAYAVEARKLLHIIADTERHRIKVSSDRLLPRALKRFTVEHWGSYHKSATELNFALNSDASVFGTLLGLLPTPAASGVGLYTKPAATVADGTLDLSALTRRYDTNRHELLTLDLDQLGLMESELREELAVWINKPDGDASEAIALKKASLALTQLCHRRELHNESRGATAPWRQRGGGDGDGGGDKRGGRGDGGDGRRSLPAKNNNKTGGGQERRNGNGGRDGNGGGGGGGGDDSDSSFGSDDTDSEGGFAGGGDRLRRQKRKLRRAKRRRRHERERVAQLQRDEEMALLKEQIRMQRSEMQQIAKAQSKSAGHISRRIHGLHIESGMVPRGFFEDDMDQYARRFGLQAKKDNAIDPDEVERAWIASYLGPKPGDPIGDLISDPHFIVSSAGVVTLADSEKVMQFVDVVADAMREGSKGGKNEGRAVQSNWPGSAKAEAVVIKLCTSIALLRRFAATLDRRQEDVRRKGNPCEGSLRAQFFGTPPPTGDSSDHEQQKYRKDLAAARTTRVFHSMFTYLFSICREEANPDVDKYFATQEGVFSARQVCKKAALIFQDLFSLRRRFRYSLNMGLLACLAWMEQLERKNWADPVIDGLSLQAPDTSLALDTFEGLLGTSKDPSVLAEKALKEAQSVKTAQEAAKKEVAALKKQHADAKPPPNHEKELEAMKKRLQRVEQANWQAGNANDGNDDGKGKGGKGGRRGNKNAAAKAAAAAAKPADGEDDA